MLFKLALRNIKKSIKDFGLFFFTLVFAVSMFYLFNSLDSQTAMLKLDSSKKEIIKALIQSIDYISIFVTIVLAFLIIYINNFLVKRRKKELAIYGVLGMDKSKISTIMVIENILVGCISLFVGLLLGIFLSQFLSIFVSQLFKVDLNKYQFVFSSSAFNKTIMYFGIIFILELILNVIIISKNKLIDLLQADKKAEKLKNRNKILIIISFILSCGLLWYAYKLLLVDKVLLTLDKRMLYMLISGALGTFFLFYSFSGILLNVTKIFKNFYYKKLNAFIFKQVDSRVNSMIVVITIISLILLLTIGLLSCSISITKLYNYDFMKNNLVDYSIYLLGDQEKNQKMYQELLNNEEYKKIVTETINIPYYSSDLFQEDLITQKDYQEFNKTFGDVIPLNDYVSIITESDYNKYLSIAGLNTIDINENEYILTSSINIVNDFFNSKLKHDKKINLFDTTLYSKTNQVENIQFINSPAPSNSGVLVVDDIYKDKLIYGFEMVHCNIHATDENYDKMFDFLQSNIKQDFLFTSKRESAIAGACVSSVIVFISLYLGIIFAITGASILAISQLCDASDNKKRYRVLRNIGADEKLINKSFFIQVLIVFLFPLIVAIVHAYFGLKEINSLIKLIGKIDVTQNIIITSMFMIIIYGGYFGLTYLFGKRIIKE